MLSSSQVLSIRARFPILRKKIYLNSCSQGALSGAVEDGMREYLASWHEHGSPWDLWVERYEAARTQFASLIGATANEVAVVPYASAGINSVASALTYRERRRVVLGEFEFPTMGHIWLAQQSRGAQVEFANAEGNSLSLQAYERLIDKKTLIVPVTGVCFMNGFRSPVADIAGLARASGALIMLDDYQDCGTRPVNVRASEVDFYVTGTLKYLLGPPGLAFLYVRQELIESLEPTITGWFAQSNPFAFDVKHLDLSPTARRFEAGSPPVPNVYGAMAGIELLQEIGLDNVAAHITDLAQTLLRGARRLGVKAKTPGDSVGPLIVLQSKDAAALVAKLAAEGIVCSSRHDGLRLALHIYNTPEDVVAVLQVLERNLDLLDPGPLAD
ncbi:MAG: aminotransferase class V-fold PLP-dependent enzyme [Terriglobales bacterium]